MSIIALRKQIELLIGKLEVNDWFPEEEGYLGMGQTLLRKMRRDPIHNKGWRYRPTEKALDRMGRVVRRNVIWDKNYLLSLFVQP